MCSKASDSKLTNWERKATILDPAGVGGHYCQAGFYCYGNWRVLSDRLSFKLSGGLRKDSQTLLESPSLSV